MRKEHRQRKSDGISACDFFVALRLLVDCGETSTKTNQTAYNTESIIIGITHTYNAVVLEAIQIEWEYLLSAVAAKPPISAIITKSNKNQQ